jgi:hypothetical protein
MLSSRWLAPGEGMCPCPFQLTIFFGDGEPHGHYGAGPGRAVRGHSAAYGLDPVAGPPDPGGAADAVIADLDGQRAVGPIEEDSTADAACLAALVKASAAT